jgi:hypothetical protein
MSPDMVPKYSGGMVPKYSAKWWRRVSISLDEGSKEDEHLPLSTASTSDFDEYGPRKNVLDQK